MELAPPLVVVVYPHWQIDFSAPDKTTWTAIANANTTTTTTTTNALQAIASTFARKGMQMKQRARIWSRCYKRRHCQFNQPTFSEKKDSDLRRLAGPSWPCVVYSRVVFNLAQLAFE